MRYFSVPADFKKETIDGYARLNAAYPDSKVKETYGNITLGNAFRSGREIDVLPKINLTLLQEYILYSQERNIEFNYTLNPSYMGNREFTKEGVADLTRFLQQLYDAGVRSLTLAMPSLMELVQLTGLDFTIKASAICEITTANKARTFKAMGMDRIVVDESVNRNFRTLKQIRQCFGEKVEVLVNVVCLNDCVYRMFHYNQTSGDSVAVSSNSSIAYFRNRCLMRRYQHIENIFKMSWIRPEDLQYYSNIGIEYFKIQGRQFVMEGDPLRLIESYFQESFEGDLMDLLFVFAQASIFTVPIDNKKLDGYIKHFYENEGFCRNDCGTCGFCKAFASKCVEEGTVQNIYNSLLEYCKHYDDFTKLVTAESDKLLTAEATIIDEDGDFEF